MNYLVIGLIWLLNLGISFLNARNCGLVWVESRVMGGWVRFMTWMGAVMAASGFSWCFLIVLALGAHEMHYLPDRETLVALQLGYLILIPGILFSGLMITIDSWVQAWRERNLANVGTAVWNTYAQIHNSYGAWNGFGEAFGSVLDYFSGGGSREKSSGDDDDDNSGGAAILLVVLVAVAILGGIIVTVAIIRSYAASTPLPRREL